jgi:hypothetical protein
MNKTMLKIIITTGVLATVPLADAQQAIFLVRHAEDVTYHRAEADLLRETAKT